jgi:plasmid stabilization system protein ParE
MKAVFSSGANRDVKDIFEYYVNEAGTDVAMDFHSELRELVERIKRWPESFPLLHRDFRRGLMKRFPFQVIYRSASADRIRIVAVRHDKQHPNVGLSR